MMIILILIVFSINNINGINNRLPTYIYDGCQQKLYYICVLRSYRYFARAPQGSRKVPAREAASNPNEHPSYTYLIL